jgi:TRAP-type C4-dicarboxylate transport system permease small subunit
MRKDFFYTPNQIPAQTRKQNALFSLLLFSYGTYGVWVNDLYIPGKRSKGIHLHDVPAWIMYGAILCACMVMLSVIVDHYDKRNNEAAYQAFGKIFKFLGWGFLGLSLVMALIR